MNPSKTNVFRIRTPEGIVFDQLLAGPVTRFLAWGVDLALIGAVMLGFGIVSKMLALISRDFSQAISILLYFVLSIGYGIVAEWYWRGQTLGKRLLRLRVIDAEGLRLQFSQVAIRNLLRFVDMLPVAYLVGGIACLASRRAQRLGDFAANTLVIRQPQLTEPDLTQLLAGKFNSLRAHPHLEARLRQRVSPGEAALALQALLRRAEFAPDARVELFGALAGHFRAKVEFPAEATDGLADEQYVRNVVDVLFRPRGARH